MTPSRFIVTFSDYVNNRSGIQISFIEGDEIKYTEFMGDADYNGAIVDWILLVLIYPPKIESLSSISQRKYSLTVKHRTYNPAWL